MKPKSSNEHSSGQAASDLRPDTTARRKNRRGLSTKKIVIIAGILIIVVAAGVFVYHLANANNPGYRTILPDNKSIGELGGWKRVSPPTDAPVFAYSDKINGTAISVSQQPLPEAFKSDPAGRVGELAKSYNATTKINAGDTVVYIGTSSKGPQSVIFTKKNLLILIKSQKAIDNPSWQEYVSSLDGAGSLPKY